MAEIFNPFGVSDTDLQKINGNLSKPLDTLFNENTQLHGIKTFVANGTFVVPTGVTGIFVTACGAGGGGSFAGGGGAMCIINSYYPVTPGQIIEITLGVGGLVV